MNILNLNPGIPGPGRNECNTRTFALLEQVAKECSITAVVLSDKKETPAVEHLQFCDSYYQIQQKRISLSAFIRRKFSKIPPAILQLNLKAVQRTVANLMKEKKFDLIHCGHASMLPAIPRHCEVPVLLQQDCQSPELFLAQITQKKRHYAEQEIRTASHFIKASWKKADGIFVPTREMHDLILSENPEAVVFIVQPGVDSTFYVNRGSINATKTIVLPGALNQNDTCEAIQEFVQQMWGVLQGHDPELRLFIVGEGASADILKLNQLKNIFVATGVDDSRKIIKEATAVIFPHHQGELVNMHVLEVLSQSKAVVATPQAVADLNVVHGQNIFIAETIDDFVEQVLKLTNDEFLRRVLGVQARAVVDAHHAWDIVAKQLLRAYKSISASADHPETSPFPAAKTTLQARGSAGI
ncbi:MAG: glycosyltransferase [Calditrichaeota bacterium]|nr:MAG: glycosyltransferase [Calditrichota bacterium]